MKEHDPLSSVLQEWEAPEPSSALDARVRAAFRAALPSSIWRRVWAARVTIPVPALAALLIAAALWLLVRTRPPAVEPPNSPPGGAYLTRVEVAGFQPLQDGATRVIRGGMSQ